MAHLNLLIFGAGGHAKVIADIAISSGHSIFGFVDPFSKDSSFESYKLFKNFDELPAGKYTVVVALGDNSLRKRVAEEVLAHGSSETSFTFISLIHPKSVIAANVKIGLGTVVMAGAIINASSVIGDHVIVNTGSIVDHDCILENYASVAPGAVLGGKVHVQTMSVISIGAICKHNIKVGVNSVVGAGSYVHRDIGENSVVYGSPAKFIRSRNLGDRYL